MGSIAVPPCFPPGHAGRERGCSKAHTVPRVQQRKARHGFPAVVRTSLGKGLPSAAPMSPLARPLGLSATRCSAPAFPPSSSSLSRSKLGSSTTRLRCFTLGEERLQSSFPLSSAASCWSSLSSVREQNDELPGCAEVFFLIACGGVKTHHPWVRKPLGAAVVWYLKLAWVQQVSALLCRGPSRYAGSKLPAARSVCRLNP